MAQTFCRRCGDRLGPDSRADRFTWVIGSLGLCRECVRDPVIVFLYLRSELPAPVESCPYPPGDDRKIEMLGKRFQNGESLFDSKDCNCPAVLKKKVGLPDRIADPGETGVEKCGNGYRVRPFWRGRRWNLGMYPTEGEASCRAREFWKLHGRDLYRPRPVIWLPVTDEDHALAIETDHLEHWRERFGFKNMFLRRFLSRFRAELRSGRIKYPTVVVWEMLENRLAAESVWSRAGLSPRGPEPAALGV